MLPITSSDSDFSGYWFYLLDAAGRPEFQGQLLSRQNVDYTVQLYDANHSPAEYLSSIALSVVHDPKHCRLYRSSIELQLGRDLFDEKRVAGNPCRAGIMWCATAKGGR